MLLPLGLLPALTFALVAYAVRPVAGDLRLALVRAAVILGAAAAALVEALSAVRALTAPALVVAWSLAMVPASAAALARYRRDGGRPRLLTGGDGLYNLLQWCAGVGCVLVAARIAGQLGGGRRAQLITALITGTTPILALEASSTQTDLVVAGWVACVATLVLDELHRRTSVWAAALIGAGAGLTALT